MLAPGVEFDAAYGLTQTDYETRTPHAWRAGTQTQLLRDQLAAMSNGGSFVMTIPKAPCRCPPGPYERACLVADCLRTAKGSGRRVIVLDENLPTDANNRYTAIQAVAHTFTQAFSARHAGVIDHRSGVSNIRIHPATTASWLTAVCQYDSLNRGFVVANGDGHGNSGITAGARAVEASSVTSRNFQQVNTWFNTLMGDSFA